MISCDLDHVALAVEAHADVWPRYGGELAGEPKGGGPDPGFNWQQLAYGNGMRIELLEPHAVEEFDFLRRFLDRNGPGPHHMTFLVDDIGDALAQATAAGYQAVNVHLESDEWKEAFLHPKSAPGIVVQLAWSDHAHDGSSRSPYRLDRIVHAVADLEDGLAIFERLLGGERLDEGKDDHGSWIELGFPGPGRIRLTSPHATGEGWVGSWLGDRRGRVHHLAFSGPVADRVEISPEDNYGTRLVIHPG